MDFAHVGVPPLHKALADNVIINCLLFIRFRFCPSFGKLRMTIIFRFFQPVPSGFFNR